MSEQSHDDGTQSRAAPEEYPAAGREQSRDAQAGSKVVTRTVERVEYVTAPRRSKADREKVADAANALIADLRRNRDSLPHGI